MKIKITFISGKEEIFENVPYKSVEEFMRKELGVGELGEKKWYFIGSNKVYAIKNIESVESIEDIDEELRTTEKKAI